MNNTKLSFRKLSEEKLGLIIFGGGILAGFLFARIFKDLYWDTLYLTDADYLRQIRETVIDYPVLLRYVLWNIFRKFFLFWILCSTALGLPYLVFCILYGGFQCGFFLTVILLRYGFKGILLIFGYTFPHYLLYIPVIFLCLRTGYWLCKSMYYDRKVGKRGRTEKIIRHLLLILVLALVLLIGGLLETYVASFLLKKILVLF
ncbi:MAG: Stage II sporulation protein M [Lachnoclostridium sp.]|jgi:stage II sporulation protein M